MRTEPDDEIRKGRGETILVMRSGGSLVSTVFATLRHAGYEAVVIDESELLYWTSRLVCPALAIVDVHVAPGLAFARRFAGAGIPVLTWRLDGGEGRASLSRADRQLLLSEVARHLQPAVRPQLD
jgi:hypothetical protein